MLEELEMIIDDAEVSMKKAIDHLEVELAKIRAGKANPGMLDGINVDYYNTPTPINQVANINILDARTISIQPWERNTLQQIERAIIASNIGLNPQNDGVLIRLFLPPLTEERRREFVKRAGGEGEHSKVAIRNIRRVAIEDVKSLQLIYLLLREKKYTIEGAKEFLKKNKKVDEKFVVIESLRKLKGFLNELKTNL